MGENNITIFPDKIVIGKKKGGEDNLVPTVEKEAGYRYGNASKARMEIRYGNDNKTFELKKVIVDYIKTPQYVNLTPEQVDLVEDTSQILEWPDYVCQEIINETVRLIMENASDPRLQTNAVVSQSIAPPQQTQQ